LPLVRRTRIVNAAQDASIHQVSRGLFNFTITFFAARHWSLRSQLSAFSYQLSVVFDLLIVVYVFIGRVLV